MRVLIVDRSQSWRFLQKRCFMGLGVREVVAVAQDSDAWECFSEMDFDIMFIDVNWNQVSSLELVSMVHQQYPELPIILLTSEANRCHVQKARQAGISDYLQKPSTPEMIQKKLLKWVGCPV